MTELFVSRMEKAFEYFLGILILNSAGHIFYYAYTKHFNQIFLYAFCFIINMIVYFIFKNNNIKAKV